ncbi:hypothetical protein J6590_056086 [Homalodisca vitripennis]|nr:hypothetical protein J6590_056086 [Homalodisca vitripennis]
MAAAVNESSQGERPGHSASMNTVFDGLLDILFFSAPSFCAVTTAICAPKLYPYSLEVVALLELADYMRSHVFNQRLRALLPRALRAPHASQPFKRQAESIRAVRGL